jgi:RNA polymerase sigma-70 factor (ECF subfamily)
LTNRKADAEDLVQDTFVRVLSSGRKIMELNQPLAFVFRVMRNQWIDHLRKRRVRTESLDDPLNVELQNELPVYTPTVQRDLENKELLNAIRQNKLRLSDREKLLLTLMAEGLSYEEIAEMLNEDLRIIRYECTALKTKLKYRFRNRGKEV